MFKFIVVLAFSPAIFALTPINRCTGDLPVPTAIYFGGRENPCLVEPCQLSRSSGIGITEVDFVLPSLASTIMPRVRAVVFGGVTITQELPESITSYPCGILTKGQCPLQAGEEASYSLGLPIDPTTPLISPATEVTLFGDNNEVIFCYRLDTRIVA